MILRRVERGRCLDDFILKYSAYLLCADGVIGLISLNSDDLLFSSNGVRTYVFFGKLCADYEIMSVLTLYRY